MTPSGIETATYRLVAQHLNHCAKSRLDIYRPVSENYYVYAQDINYVRNIG